MFKKLSTGAVVLVIVVAFMAAILPMFMRARSSPAMNACVNNLRQLDGAKQQWEFESHRTTNDPPPAVTDLHAYLRQGLVCPQGGTYTIGRVGEPPKCSIGGSHTLRQ